MVTAISNRTPHELQLLLETVVPPLITTASAEFDVTFLRWNLKRCERIELKGADVRAMTSCVRHGSREILLKKSKKHHTTGQLVEVCGMPKYSIRVY